MDGCVFCDIICAKIPAWVVYQDKKVICFLPLSPEVYGHTLIVPKVHTSDIYTTSASALKSVMDASKRLALHYQTQMGASGINLLHASGVSAQQSVFHFHMHLLPRFNNDGLNTWPTLPPIPLDKDEMIKKLRL